MRQICDPISDSELSCLNAWPEGTVGYNNDQALIQELNELCQKHGYGRVPQVVEAIKDIWYHPENVINYQQIRDQRLKYLEECRKITDE